MSAIDDAKTVIGILAGSLPDNARLIRIADAFVVYAGAAFNPADPLAPTNEEKAQNFLNMLRRDAKRVLRNVAQAQSAAADVADIQADGAAAAGDL